MLPAPARLLRGADPTDSTERIARINPMSRLRMICVALATMLLPLLTPPGMARAEVGGLHLNITPYGGYGVWAKEVNLTNRGLFGARVGVGFGPYIGVEGSYG